MPIAASIRTSKRRTRSRRRRSIAVRWFAFRSATRRACALKCARSRPDANPYMVLYSIFKTGLDGETSQDQEPAPGRALPARQHLRRAGELPQGRVDHEASRRRREGPLRRPEAGLSRSLPALPGNVREGARKCSSTTRSTTSTCGTCSKKAAVLPRTPRPRGRGVLFCEEPRPPGCRAGVLARAFDKGTAPASLLASRHEQSLLLSFQAFSCTSATHSEYTRESLPANSQCIPESWRVHCGFSAPAAESAQQANFTEHSSWR